MQAHDTHGTEAASGAEHGVADAAHAGAAAGAHGGEHAAAAFPPFDASLFPGQLFWFALTFIVVYLIFSRTALPKVGAVLAKREATVKGDLESAAQKSADADAARAAMEQAVAKARADARTLIEAQRAKVQAELAAEQEKAEAALADRIGVAETRIATARAKAMGEVDSLARDLAATVVERIVPRTAIAAE